jgi:hypothetical protein
MYRQTTWLPFLIPRPVALTIGAAISVTCAEGPTAPLCVDCWVVVDGPLPDERFISGDVIAFSADQQGNWPSDTPDIQWSSSLDGHIGTGPTIATDRLSVGSHTVTASAGGVEQTATVRVFPDLWALYRSAPAQGEIDRILNDFDFVYVDDLESGENWSSYGDFQFDQTSSNPSKIVVLAKLDILRRQQFSEPLPFTSSATAYEYVRSHVQQIHLRLDCGYSSGGGGMISLNRNASVWDARRSGTSQDPDACKSTLQSRVYTYVAPLQLVVHEARHSDPGDPGHAVCANGVPGDWELENGSGYAWGAMYAMWVYKYGLFDASSAKTAAREIAVTLLNRICTKPTHSNPVVQDLLNELLGS